MTTETKKASATIQVVAAIAEAIRELKEVPSGHLYTMLMDKMTLDQYNAFIGALKRAGLVSEQYHLLKWIGPTI
jgi:hypothetical protein